MDLIELYDRLLEILREHHEEICCRVMRGRAEGKGNFAYLPDNPEFKLMRKTARILTTSLWNIHLQNIGQRDKSSRSGTKCFGCSFARYNFHSVTASNHWCNERPEKWYCQGECEHN